MGFGSFFKKLAPWLSAGCQFVPGAGPAIAATINGIAQTHGVTLPAPADHSLPDTIENAVAALTGKAEALAALRKADQDFQERMQAAGFKQITDLQALENADRADARNREAQVKDWTPRVLAYAMIVLFGIVSWAILFREIKADSVLAGTVIGFIASEAKQIFTYYFGSSAGSEAKSQVIADIAKQP